MEIGDFSMDFFSLAGKRAIVTGGNTGLGQAFTLALAKAGANVFVPSMMDDDGTTGPLVTGAGDQSFRSWTCAKGLTCQVIGRDSTERMGMCFVSNRK